MANLWSMFIIQNNMLHIIKNSPCVRSYYICLSGLKPGRVIRVNRVTFCPGHPGQTRFIKYPGLTRILYWITCIFNGVWKWWIKRLVGNWHLCRIDVAWNATQSSRPVEPRPHAYETNEAAASIIYLYSYIACAYKHTLYLYKQSLS